MAAETFFFAMGVSPRALPPARALAVAVLAQTHLPWLHAHQAAHADRALLDYARRPAPFCPETFAACLTEGAPLAETAKGHALFDAFMVAASGALDPAAALGLFLFGFFRQTRGADEAAYVRAVRSLPGHRHMTEAVRAAIAALYESGRFTQDAFNELSVRWGA